MSPKVLWDVVRTAATRAGIDKLAPHDLRRTCARLHREDRRGPAAVGGGAAGVARRGEKAVLVVRVIFWTHQARADLAAIQAFVSQDSPHYASVVVSGLIAATDHLVQSLNPAAPY